MHHKPFFAAFCAILLITAPAVLVASFNAPDNFDGPTGGEIKFTGGTIDKVDGDGNWILWGAGQDLVIRNKKDGKGSLTLKGFGKVKIDTKNGDGGLTVEDCSGIELREVNGKGDVYLNIKGPKFIHLKDGDGNVYFKGEPPEVKKKNGVGKVERVS